MQLSNLTRRLLNRAQVNFYYQFYVIILRSSSVHKLNKLNGKQKFKVFIYKAGIVFKNISNIEVRIAVEPLINIETRKV